MNRGRSWWQELEAGQTQSATGSDASHWVAVYTDLIRTMNRMAVEATLDPALARRLEHRLHEAEERRAYWVSVRGSTA